MFEPLYALSLLCSISFTFYFVCACVINCLQCLNCSSWAPPLNHCVMWYIPKPWVSCFIKFKFLYGVVVPLFCPFHLFVVLILKNSHLLTYHSYHVYIHGGNAKPTWVLTCHMWKNLILHKNYWLPFYHRSCLIESIFLNYTPNVNHSTGFVSVHTWSFQYTGPWRPWKYDNRDSDHNITMRGC